MKNRHLIDDDSIESITKPGGCCFGKYRIFVPESYSYSCVLGESANCSHNELKYNELSNCQLVTCCANQKFSCEQCSIYLNQDNKLMNEVEKIMAEEQQSEVVSSNEEK